MRTSFLALGAMAAAFLPGMASAQLGDIVKQRNESQIDPACKAYLADKYESVVPAEVLNRIGTEYDRTHKENSKSNEDPYAYARRLNHDAQCASGRGDTVSIDYHAVASEGLSWDGAHWALAMEGVEMGTVPPRQMRSAMGKICGMYKDRMTPIPQDQKETLCGPEKKAAAKAQPSSKGDVDKAGKAAEDMGKNLPGAGSTAGGSEAPPVPAPTPTPTPAPTPTPTPECQRLCGQEKTYKLLCSGKDMNAATCQAIDLNNCSCPK